MQSLYTEEQFYAILLQQCLWLAKVSENRTWVQQPIATFCNSPLLFLELEDTIT
jgi:hypothetical protein